jgi:formate/nitrite transporter FocA (FNT family)
MSLVLWYIIGVVLSLYTFSINDCSDKYIDPVVFILALLGPFVIGMVFFALLERYLNRVKIKNPFCKRRW